MDLRLMQLGDSDAQNLVVTGFSKEEYQLDERQSNLLTNFLNSAKSTGFWDPAYQALYPFVKTYLRSGNTPELTREWMPYLQEKQNYLFPVKPSARHDIYSDIIKYYTKSAIKVFDGVPYGDIQHFSKEVCGGFLDRQKWIVNNLYTQNIYNSTFTELLTSGSYNKCVLAVYVYRQMQIERNIVNNSNRELFVKFVNNWIAKYCEMFETVMHALGDKVAVYDWYNPIVENIVKELWEQSLTTGEASRDIMNKAKSLSLQANVSDKVVQYIGGSPVWGADPLSPITVFDIFYSFMFESEETCEDYTEKAALALTVPKKSFAGMCKTMFDFYWMVDAGMLTTKLYGRQDVNYMQHPGTELTADEYLSVLYSLGYPKVKEE